MQVRPLTNGQPPSEPTRRRLAMHLERPAGGLLALLFGLPLWALGGWYTLNGWAAALNLLSAKLAQPRRLDAPAGEVALLVMVGLALAYSLVEVRLRPRAPRGDYGFWALATLLWLVVILTDVGSTFLGVTTPGADAWAITRQVAASPYLAGAWALILTFVPEAFILLGIRLLFGK